MTREELYDAEIFPLMTKIIEICKAGKIPMLADFDLSDEDQPSLKCTSFLIEEEWSPDGLLVQACKILNPRSTRPPVMITVDHGDGSKTVTAVI